MDAPILRPPLLQCERSVAYQQAHRVHVHVCVRQRGHALWRRVVDGGQRRNGARARRKVVSWACLSTSAKLCASLALNRRTATSARGALHGRQSAVCQWPDSGVTTAAWQLDDRGLPQAHVLRQLLSGNPRKINTCLQVGQRGTGRTGLQSLPTRRLRHLHRAQAYLGRGQSKHSPSAGMHTHCTVASHVMQATASVGAARPGRFTGDQEPTGS